MIEIVGASVDRSVYTWCNGFVMRVHGKSDKYLERLSLLWLDPMVACSITVLFCDFCAGHNVHYF